MSDNFHSTLTIEQLPNECLQLILDFLPFVDLLRNVPLVCQRWNEIQELLCKRKTSLILYGDYESLIPEPLSIILNKYIGVQLRSNSYQAFQCTYSIRQPITANRLLLERKFPNINTLSLIQFRLTPDLETVYDLIKLWPELTGFRVICYRAKEDMDRQVWDKICGKLNILTKVRYLALYSRCSITGFDHNQLTFLPQVQALHLAGFEVDLARLKNIRRLSLYHMLNNHWFEQLKAMNDEIAKNITELTIYPSTPDLGFNYLDELSPKFTQLTFLYIRTRLTLKEVIPPLARLTKLEHVRIWNYMLAGIVSTIAEDDLPIMPEIPSVVMLHIYIRLNCHRQLEWIPHVFPSLKWIKIDRCRIDCTDCPDIHRKQCERAILSPLKKCAKLCRIYLDRKSLQIDNSKTSLDYLTQYDELSPSEL